MSTLKGMIPGSFDPPTIGHIDIIKRASFLCEKLYVVIACNPEKKCLFSVEERKKMLEQLLAGYKNIEVCVWNGMVVEFAEKNGIGLIVRGLRNTEDYEYEKVLADAYKSMMPDIEIAYLMSRSELKEISSSSVKVMALNGTDVSSMVPTEVFNELQRKTDC